VTMCLVTVAVVSLSSDGARTQREYSVEHQEVCLESGTPTLGHVINGMLVVEWGEWPQLHGLLIVHIFFATTEEPVLYCVSFLGEGESAIPLMDLSKVCLDNGDVAGGLVQNIQWDPSGHRVAVSFKNTNSICLLRSKPKQSRLSPVGWVTGSISGEFPVCMQFQQSPSEFGAVLTIVWSNDRVQHLPLVFNIKEDILADVSETQVEELFTSF